MAYSKQEKEVQGYVDLYESNPEFKTVMYGTLRIPLELLQEAAENDTYETKDGTTMVSLNVELYEFDPNFSKIERKVNPVYTGYVKKAKKKEGQKPAFTKRGRF